MIGPLKITLNAARPGTLPLPPVEAVVGSASTLYIYGAPGVCTSLSVRLFDFDGVASDIAATAAGNCWVVTLPASARYGKITGGVTVIGAGRDETGAAREWILGVGDYWVYNTDGEIAGGEEYTAAAQLAAAAAQTAQGKAETAQGKAETAQGKAETAQGKAETAQAAAEQAAREAASAVESCVPNTRTVNGKALSSDITLTASDVGALPDSGNLLLNGSINARNFLSAAQLIVGTASNGLIFSQDALFVYATVKVDGTTIATYKFPKDSSLEGDNGNIARLLDFYAAVQQIAPAWDSQFPYIPGALVSYNGIVYEKAYGTIPRPMPPPADTGYWRAKKVSELFLSKSGNQTLDGDLTLGTFSSEKALWFNALTGILGLSNIGGYDENRNLMWRWPNSALGDTLALLQNLAANYSTSATYAVGQLCVHANKLYHCTNAIETAEAWTDAHWTEATVEDVLAAIRSALALKAPLASPAFTGTPTAPTPTAGDDSTKVATTAFVKTAIAGATPNLDYVMRVDPETGGIYYTTPDTNA